MAKQIIILNANPVGDGVNQNVNYLFWLTVPTANQVRVPNAVSQFTGASTAELASLQSGAVIEESYSQLFPVASTLGSIQTALQPQFSSRQTAVTSGASVIKWYGTSWDGASWTANASYAPPAGKRIRAALNISLISGDNTILPATAGVQYFVDRMFLAFSGPGTVTFKDTAANVLIGPVDVVKGDKVNFDDQDDPWLPTALGAGLVINSTASMTIGGVAWYRKG